MRRIDDGKRSRAAAQMGQYFNEISGADPILNDEVAAVRVEGGTYRSIL
ncbi:hypothetical protein [Burkholderia multivorans]|nr:hypothetical protein [Burkholderia multivorans]MBR8103437.1 hypothetical protein [Burkholderia multivorans]MBR8243741.1 hypothetical protein [Burkholderia multivorans]MBR8340957.1 hypothetical protein [Burkholderia multivorans]MBU9432265.1 hypothetical protein [Burkholderia multivorans]